MSALVIAIIVFVVVALAIFAVITLFDERRAQARLIKDRLATVQKAAEREPDRELALLRDEQLSHIPAFDTLLRRSARVSAIQEALVQAGLKYRAGNFLVLCLVCGGVTGFAALVLDGQSRHRLGPADLRRIHPVFVRVLPAAEAL